MVKLGAKIKRVVSSVDWGYKNPGVIQAWGLDGDDRMYLVHEIYQTGKQIDWWVAKAKEIEAFYRPELFCCDPAEPAFIDAFRAAGLNAIKAYNDVLMGIQAVQQRLRRGDDGLPRLFIHADACPERDPVLVEARKPACTAEEFPGYIWKPPVANRAVKEEPVKINDHGQDACRYAVAEVDGLGTYSAGAW